MKKPIRFSVWAWGGALDDLTAFCLPSLAQPNNIPWLARNGYSVSLDFFTRKCDETRIAAIANAYQSELRDGENGASITGSLSTVSDDLSEIDLKSALFRRACRNASDASGQGIFAFADRFFGDGSIRNIVTYAEKPHVTVSGLQLAVDRERFRTALHDHHSATGGAAVSNARLTDMCLNSLSDGMRASFVDDDVNASFATGTSFLPLSDELCSVTSHLLRPMLFDMNAADIGFFQRFQDDYALFNHVWPSMLVAQNRWRVMASSDLFCVADITGPESATRFPQQSGRRYNDEYEQEHMHGRMQQTTLMALRRERLA